MDWAEITLTVPAEHAELAAAVANMAAPGGLYIEDYSDIEQGVREIAHVDLIDESLLSRDRSKTVIRLYVSAEENPAETTAFLRERLDNAGIEFEITTSGVREDDWANSWKQYFKPLVAGDRLIICPTWEKPPSADGRKVLYIDPGMAFGTGGHHTTRLVLEAMERRIKGGETVLDVGCGSGILSIAALLLGAERADGVDIDPLAVRIARENGKINGFGSPEYNIIHGNLADGISGRYDLIAANISADAVVELISGLRRFLKPGGVFISSGIIDTAEKEVLACLKQHGFVVLERRESGGWVALVSSVGD
ncbi:MAG TPA: 50S ribosomal protein L11 methyltransferase [Candidatus Avimonas sp.]|jgi:ribosomal protein L11 methyltransferase|nr:50S ribosomal protein L11 methyltransferase [Clostridiales bacterium]HOB36435.1 50S ribosomal protein L11 methyltransferase [Candidatus Avimonas sp.]HQA15775.1 50S ribosomal protein L11 methyltransferase [Candidatus Avimonas sp.]HQD37903.1 50S ribosomal protein L11 methyltransferase [Candidatus Avimonas sp.]